MKSRDGENRIACLEAVLSVATADGWSSAPFNVTLVRVKFILKQFFITYKVKKRAKETLKFNTLRLLATSIFKKFILRSRLLQCQRGPTHWHIQADRHSRIALRASLIFLQETYAGFNFLLLLIYIFIYIILFN